MLAVITSLADGEKMPLNELARQDADNIGLVIQALAKKWPVEERLAGLEPG